MFQTITCDDQYDCYINGIRSTFSTNNKLFRITSQGRACNYVD